MLRSAGAESRSSFGAMNETSRPVDLLLAVRRDAPGTLGAQIEDQLRRAIRDGALRPGARVPSTRDLARQLGVSRRVAVGAAAGRAAGGGLVRRGGPRPPAPAARGRRSGAAATAEAAARPPAAVRFDFRPSAPDVSRFPRQAWLRAVRQALADMTDADLGYGDPRGAGRLRGALAEHLGRTRGVVADPDRVVVTCGFQQGLDLICRVLVARGARRVAFEDPSFPEQREIAARAGLEPVGVPVDGEGLRVDALHETDADAVVVTAAHQHPTGVVLSGERRAALLAWLRDDGRIAIEDDYDAEYRYDRAAVGALQGLDPEHVVYAGSASKTLAPALRLGWLVLPRSLIEPVAEAKHLADQQTDRIAQLAFASFLARSELDRHLRRMRADYRARRDALVAALAEELSDATVRGIAAGLHATVQLRATDDEAAILAEAHERRIALATMSAHRMAPDPGPPVLLLGYGQAPEAAIGPGVREVAAAVRAARARR